jgi:hypothetical protein
VVSLFIDSSFISKCSLNIGIAQVTPGSLAGKIRQMEPSRPQERRWLALILILFVLLGSTYALVTPVFEASDELWHYPMISHLADGNPLPVQVFDPRQAGPWNQEASQPPLYYYLGAALTFWIEPSDMEEVRWLNPHVDNGVITADGNTNLVIHNPAANPWQGTLLAVRIVRLFSVLLGATTVYLTYRIGREVAPSRPEIALGAAAANAFLPMFLFISGAVNNDNLAIPLASLTLLLLILMVKHERMSRLEGQSNGLSATIQRIVLLGVVIGLAVLTKEGTLGLIPLAVGTMGVVAWQQGEQGRAAHHSPSTMRRLPAILLKTLAYSAVMFLPILLIAGWWYYRNIQLYGDWLGWNAFIAVLGQRAHPASLNQLWGESSGFMMAYWGLFGGVNVPMASWIYRLLNGVVVVSVVGFVIYAIQLLRVEIKELVRRVGNPPYIQLRRLLILVERHFSLLVCVLFAAAVVYGLIQWATTTWSSQGRLVFTAISALTVLMVVGLVGWLPSRAATWVVGALGAFLLVVAALAPFLWIRPAYQPPRAAGTLQESVAIHFGDAIRLNGYRLERRRLQPGESVWLWLEWEALRPMERDWSVFVHLNDPVIGRPIAQRDMYPGQGLLATRLLKPGERTVNRYYLTIPPTAIAPAELELAVGLYDYDTCPDPCERLPAGQGSDAAVLETITLDAPAGNYPNPVAVEFEHGLELVGFAVSPRRVEPGEEVTLTTYWRANRPLSEDYTFFAQIVDEDTTRWSHSDVVPEPATSSWTEGAVQEVEMTLPVSLDTPPELYPLIIGMYTQTAGGDFDRLQLVTADGRRTDDYLLLAQIRVD